MFATRGHNENAIYDQQTAAAAKPLNQGVKGLAPKTPGNKAPKTPFKVPLNDENAAFGNGKTGGKGKDGGLFGKSEGGKAERSAFVTPAGPRTRAPLGNKTTNAKAGAAPPTQEKLSAKPTSPRMRRAKVKIHQAEADPLDNGVEEREIEYMAPRGVPLPDHPDDCFPHDRTYPQFEGRNLTKGWWSEVQPHKDVDGEEELSDFEEKLKEVEEREKRKAARKNVRPAGLQQARKPTTTTAAMARPPSTLRSRTAASALSSAPKQQRVTPSFAAPTAAAKARLPSALLASSKPALGTTSAPGGNARHTAAKAASNTTLGYSKGRAVSATARTPLAGIHEPMSMSKYEVVKKKSASPAKVRPVFGGVATLDELLGLQSLVVGEGEGDDDDLGGFGDSADAPGIGEDEEELEFPDFQLEPIEL
ncbi:hypothetical protein LTR36_002368 [Oleoguttula mirabilis]|uniref:Uncharacterized protein n=1 Tax=Oleoguttula mirabilis TaxID=1507867 RepID=A0AAV9JLK0_9PEZI|nr:hypothetical protein LTR36_002368 [Oleoguttula mirabilis]